MLRLDTRPNPILSVHAQQVTTRIHNPSTEVCKIGENTRRVNDGDREYANNSSNCTDSSGVLQNVNRSEIIATRYRTR